MKPTSPIETRASLLTLEGPDALAFAHAQFTSDVLALEPGQWQWSAWLDARGRVQGLLQLARVDDTTLVALLRGGSAARTGERLGRFVFRSRVRLAAQDALTPRGGQPLPAFRHASDADMQVFGLGERSLVLAGPGAGDDDWMLAAIRHGEPWLPDAFLDTLLPPALGLRRLDAISLVKGCYPGQEIAARLHYHGGHKYALAHLRLPRHVEPGTSTAPPGPGMPQDTAHPMRILQCVAVEDVHEALAVVHEDTLRRMPPASDASAGEPALLRRFDE